MQQQNTLLKQYKTVNVSAVQQKQCDSGKMFALLADYSGSKDLILYSNAVKHQFYCKSRHQKEPHLLFIYLLFFTFHFFHYFILPLFIIKETNKQTDKCPLILFSMQFSIQVSYCVAVSYLTCFFPLILVFLIFSSYVL